MITMVKLINIFITSSYSYHSCVCLCVCLCVGVGARTLKIYSLCKCQVHNTLLLTRVTLLVNIPPIFPTL